MVKRWHSENNQRLSWLSMRFCVGSDIMRSNKIYRKWQSQFPDFPKHHFASRTHTPFPRSAWLSAGYKGVQWYSYVYVCVYVLHRARSGRRGPAFAWSQGPSVINNKRERAWVDERHRLWLTDTEGAWLWLCALLVPLLASHCRYLADGYVSLSLQRRWRLILKDKAAVICICNLQWEQ